jgi:hypothetical protein
MLRHPPACAHHRFQRAVMACFNLNLLQAIQLRPIRVELLEIFDEDAGDGAALLLTAESWPGRCLLRFSRPTISIARSRRSRARRRATVHQMMPFEAAENVHQGR